MALSNAVLLANIASGDALTVDTTNDRVGVGSTTPDVTLDVIGIISATSFSGDGSLLTNVGFDTSYISGVAATFTGNVTVGGVLTYEDVANVDSVGIITAQSGLRVVGGGITAVGVATFYNGIDLNTSFSKINTGSGVNVVFQDQGVDKLHFEVSAQGIRPNTANTGEVGNATYPFHRVTTQNLVATSGVNVTGVVTATSYIGDGSQLEGISAGGITTEAQVKTTGQTALLALSTAVDHKVTCTGTVTIDVTGGTQEGESHTLRIVNNGTATVGFSTYFLFPSGATPSLPTADGAISLISFTIHRAGSTGISTQLLSGSSVNYS